MHATWHWCINLSHITTTIVLKNEQGLLSCLHSHLYLFSFLRFQIDRMGQQDSAVEEEVRYRYNSVILHYKKSQDNTQR
jgi:hypothetical protein